MDSRTTAVLLQSDPSSPARARLALDPLGERIGARRLVDARLLVSELVTNAVKHAPVRFAEAIEMRIELGRRLRIEIEDRNPHFRERVRPERLGQNSGFGLVVVDRLADRWGVDERAHAGNIVWFELELES